MERKCGGGGCGEADELVLVGGLIISRHTHERTHTKCGFNYISLSANFRVLGL